MPDRLQEPAMSSTTLVAETGRTIGSRSSNRLRADGKIPGVVYGHGMTAVSVAVDRRALRAALTGPAGLNAVLTLSIDGATQSAVVKDMQRDKVRHNVTHIDFQVVSLDEAITVEVPVVLVGEAKAVIAEGGLVDRAVDTLSVRTTPRAIPTEITVDITNMGPHDVIRVSDLTLPKGATVDADEDLVVVAVLYSAEEPVVEAAAPPAEE